MSRLVQGLSATALATAILAVTMCLTGCTSPKAPDVDFGSSPWASEFKAEYEATDDPFVREVLSDGVITDQEEAEMWDRFVTCMAGEGIIVTNIKPGGSYQYKYDEARGPDYANEVDTRCMKESGQNSIGALYAFIRRNPDNIDESKVMVDCLIRKKAVPEDYTVSQYNIDNDGAAQSYPYLDKDAGPLAYQECAVDPLGLFE